MDSTTGDVAQLLRRYRVGDRAAEAELFKRLYAELSRPLLFLTPRERPYDVRSEVNAH